MIEILSISALLVPAIAIFWRGRRVLRHLGDPSLDQLHFAKAQFGNTALAFGMIASMVLSAEYSAVKLGVLVVSLLVADLPYRRRLFGETWGVLRYLSFQLRFGFMMFGPLLLAALLPVIARPMGEHAVPVAIALAVVVQISVHLHPQLARLLVRARPIEVSELVERFAAVVDKSTAAKPHIWHFGCRGGHLVNAFALPSIHRSAVVLSDDLLAAVGPREATAIFAHEMAHLEDHTRAKRLRSELFGMLQLVAGVLFVVYLGAGVLLGDLLQWFFALVVIQIATHSGRSRDAEFRSDLRAVELCGDPQALIDGLNKIHLLNHQPRHWSADMAAKLTHPSLAQRVRAVREAAGMVEPVAAMDPRAPAADAAAADAAAPPADPQPAGAPVASAGAPAGAASRELVVISADGSGTVVALTGERLHWMRGIPLGTPLQTPALVAAASDLRTLGFTELADLRLEVQGMARGHRLVAVRAGETPWTMGVSAQDVPRIERHLRGIDHLLGSTARGAEPPTAGSSASWMLRLDGILMMVLALLPFSGTLLLASLAAAIFPCQATLAAAGTVAVAGSVASFLIGGGGWLAAPELMVVNLGIRGVFGALMLVAAWRRYRRGDVDPPWARWLVLVPLLGIALVSGVLGAVRLASPFPWVQLHRWAAGAPALLLATLGLAAAFATIRRPWARGLAVAGVVLVAALVVVAQPFFVETVGRDPLVRAGPDAVLDEPDWVEVRRLTVADFAEIELSPGGGLLIETYPSDPDWEYEFSGTAVFKVELEGGNFYGFEAIDATFVDDDRLLVLEDGDDHLWLGTRTLLPTASGEIEIRLPYLEAAELWVDPSAGTWWVTGVEPRDEGDGVWEEGEGDEPESLLIEGDLVGAVPTVHRWKSFVGGSMAYGVSTLTPAGGIAVRTNYDLSGLSWMLMLGAGGGFSDTRIEWLESLDAPSAVPPELATSMSVQCLAAPGSRGSALCLASDTRRSTLWSLDLDATSTPTWDFEPVATFEAEFATARFLGDGRLWLEGLDQGSVVFDLEANRGIRLRLPTENDGGSDAETDPVSAWFERQFGDWAAVTWTAGGSAAGQRIALGLYDEEGDVEIRILELAKASP